MSVTGDLPDLGAFGRVTERSVGKAVIAVPREDVPGIAARLLAELDVLDLTIEDPPIEEVIERTFASGDEDAAESERAGS